MLKPSLGKFENVEILFIKEAVGRMKMDLDVQEKVRQLEVLEREGDESIVREGQPQGR